MPDLASVVRTASAITDRVLVAYSGGKDSVVTLDLCAKYFKRIDAFFMYQVPGLSFQEKSIRWAEHKYNIDILRVPHFEVSDFLKYGTYHAPDYDVRLTDISDVYNYVREQTGTYWIAAGERIADSIVRRAMIKRDGTINEKRGRIFPVAHWSKAHITQYIKRNSLRVSNEAQVMGHSFRDLSPKSLYLVKQHFPNDYEKILRVYPLAEAGVKKYEFDRQDAENNKTPEFRDSDDTPQ